MNDKLTLKEPDIATELDTEYIEVFGARVHNLKDIDIIIPE